MRQEQAQEGHDEKGAKTPAALRNVPIHPLLIEAGLVELATIRAAAGLDWLFPGLRADSVGNRSKESSRRLNRRFRLIGIRDREKVFHSHRHTMKRALRDDDRTKEEIADLLAGHSSASVGRKYGKGAGLKTLDRAIRRLKYPSIDWKPVIALGRAPRANFARGVELALAERDPACRVTITDDILPASLKAKYAKGEDAFPLHWLGQDEKQLQDRVVAQTRDRSGPARGRLYLSDLVADGTATVSYSQEVVPDSSGPVTIATAKPTDKVKGWTKTYQGYPVICHARSKLAGVDNFTTPVDTPVGKLVQVDYRYEIDEVAPWVIAKGAEATLRDSQPDGGVSARIALVATNEGWQPVRRGRGVF